MKVLSSLLIFVAGMVFLSCGDRKHDENKADLVNKQAISKEPDHPGKLVYLQFCLSCHMAKGEGVPGLYPPLIRTELIAGNADRLIEIVLQGLEGLFIVNGEYYNNAMTKLDFLTDQQIAEVLSYVRSNFGNNYADVSVEKVKEVRSKLPK